MNGETCELIGIVDADQVVVRSADACGVENASVRVESSAMDGMARQGLVSIAPESASRGRIVQTRSGPKYVFVTFDPQGTQTFHVQDIASGEIVDPSWASNRRRARRPTDPSARSTRCSCLTTGAHLGVAWRLPTMPGGDRPMPLFINLVSGERIELVNPPH